MAGLAVGNSKGDCRKFVVRQDGAKLHEVSLASRVLCDTLDTVFAGIYLCFLLPITNSLAPTIGATKESRYRKGHHSHDQECNVSDYSQHVAGSVHSWNMMVAVMCGLSPLAQG